MEIFSKPAGLNVQIISAEQQENDRKEAKQEAIQKAKIAREEAIKAKQEANNAIECNAITPSLKVKATRLEARANKLELSAGLIIGGDCPENSKLTVFGESVDPLKNYKNRIRSSGNNSGELTHLQWLKDTEKGLTTADIYVIDDRIQELKQRLQGGKSKRRKKKKSVRRKSVRRQKRLV